MPIYFPQRSRLTFSQALAPFHLVEGLPFANVLSAAVVEQAFASEKVSFGDEPHAVFTPAVILWAFLSQAVEKDKSCRAAVARVQALRVASNQAPCSSNTGDYCRARAKLPSTVPRRLALDVGRNLEAQVPLDWLWHGRHVSLVDGTTLDMADTSANQLVYPQQSGQAPGLGFPILRAVVVLSLATACLLALATGPYSGKETGETALLRALLDDLAPGSILVADRYYCSYWLIAMALARGIDVVFRMHHLRDYDFSRGEQLGTNDHVVTWHRPARPEWMDTETYARIPLALTMRELQFDITTPGCRTPHIVVATTLTEAAKYPKEDIGDLYHDRWHAELDIHAIKQSLSMDHLSCKSPFMIEKELWVSFLAYNLIRKTSCQAALLQEVHPRSVSFTATKQSIHAARSQLTHASQEERQRQGVLLLEELGKERVGNRPDRYEPRLVKRRPKQYKHLKEPRESARARLLVEKTE